MANSSLERGGTYTPDTSRSIISTEPFPIFIETMQPPKPRAPPKTFDEMFLNDPKTRAKLGLPSPINPQSTKVVLPNAYLEPPLRDSYVESDDEYETQVFQRMGKKEREKRKERLEVAYGKCSLLLSHREMSSGEMEDRESLLAEREKIKRRLGQLAREKEKDRVMGLKTAAKKGRWSWKWGDDAKMMRLTDAEMRKIRVTKRKKGNDDRRGLRKTFKSEDRQMVKKRGIWKRTKVRLGRTIRKLRSSMFE